MNSPVTRAATRTVASILVALSGLILFSDKVITYEFVNTYGFKSSKTFIWVFAQTLSPILLCLAGVFKPYKISYAIPVYIYFIQLYWIFDPSLKLDDELLHVYATGAAVAFLALVRMINVYIYKANREQMGRVRLLENMLDLYFKADGKK